MATSYVDTIQMKAAGTIYFGDKDTNGSWKEVRSGNDLLIYRREAGTWVEKGGWSS